MAVTINIGDRQTSAGTFGAVESLLSSTATARQVVSPVIPITQIAGSTATAGPNLNNLFTLQGATATNPPVEGMEKIIKMTSTGPTALLVVESLATGPLWNYLTTSSDDQRLTAPTGAFVFNSKVSGLWLKFLDQQWQVLGGNATIATGT